MTKKQEKLIDERISTAYRQECSGIAIPIMKLTEVYKVGRSSIASGASEEELRKAIKDYVDTIRQD